MVHQRICSACSEECRCSEIRALGHIPRHKRGAEDALSQCLYYAKRKRQLSESQLAELAEFQGSESRMDTLMAQIRALGHIPRPSRVAENVLSQRLNKAKSKRQLSESPPSAHD